MNNFIGGNLPLFPMRQSTSIEREGTRTYITTYYDKYILDDSSLEGSYAERRLFLSFGQDYKLYPLKYICNTMAEVVNSGATRFINNEGRMFTWKKTKSYLVIPRSILQTNQLGLNKYELFYKLPEGGISRSVSSKPHKYVHLIKLGPMCYMPYDYGETAECSQRKKL
ncbi:MAG: hypothetical protein ACRCUJ_05610 [Phocaeicola sp.]